MNIGEEKKLLDAGFTLINGFNDTKRGHIIKAKTPEQPQWHIIEKGIKTIKEARKRLLELVKNPKVIDLHDSAKHYRRIEPEKEILFWGDSDDRMIVEDEEHGAAEYLQENGIVKSPFEVRCGDEALLVYPVYANACWSFAISQVDEDTPLPDWWSRLWTSPFDAPRWNSRKWSRSPIEEMPTYSAVLQIDAPEGAVVLWKGLCCSTCHMPA